MVLNRFRYLLPRFINRPVDFCVKNNITPNQISMIGLLLSTLAAITLALPDVFFRNHTAITESFYWWWACVPGWLFFLGAYVDAIDGSVARKTGLVSKFGGFFDSTLDRLSDAVVFLGFMYSNMLWPWDENINNFLAFLCLSIVLLISYTRSRAEIEGVIMKGIGFMERAERVFIILGGYSIAWAAYAIERQYYPESNSDWVFSVFFIIFILLCLQTLIARISWTYKWLNNKIPEEVKNELRLDLTKVKKNEDNNSEDEISELVDEENQNK